MGRIKEADRKRARHDKVRSGCDQCKKRRIKCPEGEPCRRCTIASLECTYSNVPKPPPIRSENDRTDTSTVHAQQWTGFWHDELPDLTWSDQTVSPSSEWCRQQRTPRSDVVSVRSSIQRRLSAVGSTLNKSPQDTLYTGSLEQSARTFSQFWLENWTAPRSVLKLPVWMERIHQRAYYFPPLRDLVVVMGSIGLSLARGDDASTHLLVQQKSQKYLDAAVAGLSTATLPPSVMLYCVWIFWQLDLIRGNLATSYMHVMSAKKIAAQAEPTGDFTPAEIAGLFGIGEPNWGIDMNIAPDAFLPSSPPAKRKSASLPVIKGTWFDVSAMIMEVNVDQTIPDTDDAKERILKILEHARSDLEWLLRKWTADVASDPSHSAVQLEIGQLVVPPSLGLSATPTPPTLLQEWISSDQDAEESAVTHSNGSHLVRSGEQPILPSSTSNSSSSNSNISPQSTSTSTKGHHHRQPPPPQSFANLFSRALQMARDDGFTDQALKNFRIHCLQFVPQLVVLVAQTDLSMRHDEFLLLSRTGDSGIREKVAGTGAGALDRR